MNLHQLRKTIFGALAVLTISTAVAASASLESPTVPSIESQVNPGSRTEPEPIPQWTAIAPKDVHIFDVFITGWTIFSLQAGDESPVDIYLYNQSGNELASFDSTGCGYFLKLDRPQVITVVIVNNQEVKNLYRLYVIDS